MRDYYIDNKLSAWYCGKNVAYDFCYNGMNANCDNHNGSRGAGAAKSPLIKRENSVTVVYLYDYDVINEAAVMLFEDKDCTGTVGRFYGPAKDSSADTSINYNSAELEKHNIDANTASSMMIPYGLNVVLIRQSISNPQC